MTVKALGDRGWGQPSRGPGALASPCSESMGTGIQNCRMHMFVTMLEREGHTWAVEIRRADHPGAPVVEFWFSRTGASGETVRHTWQASGESLEALSKHGIDVSDDLLHRYLRLAEARTVDAR
jgi:hypothetical protein